MKSSRLVRASIINSFFIMLAVLLVVQSGALFAQDDSEVNNGNGNVGLKQKMPWQGKKDGSMTFDEDTGIVNGHKAGKPGKRVGHSDDMPGQRLGHRKGDVAKTGSDQSYGSFPDKTSSYCSSQRGFGFRRRFNSDLHGRKGNCNSNEHFLPRRRFSFNRNGIDNDNNPPGRNGGPGTNWENLPGRRGGPGMSPDRLRRGSGNGASVKRVICRRRFESGNFNNQQNNCGNKIAERGFLRRGRFAGRSEDGTSSRCGSNANKGSNGLHIGNRKNGVGKGIKNYTGNNPGRGRGKNK
ncbi:MAG: hypothetical protein Kow0029_00140 [Candidatus Rifleibacteriota bacterium]